MTIKAAQLTMVNPSNVDKQANSERLHESVKDRRTRVGRYATVDTSVSKAKRHTSFHTS